MANEVKLRNQIDPQWQWDLTPIYANNEAWEADFSAIQQEVNGFAQWKGKAASEPKQVIPAYFQLQFKLQKLYAYTYMHRDEDNGNTIYQALCDRAGSLMVSAQAACAFIQPELLSLPEDELKKLMVDPDMKDYDTYLRAILLEKPHTLPADQEEILALTGEMADTPDTVFSMLTSVDMQFPDVENEDGVKVPLTESIYSSFIRSDKQAVRKAAFTSLFETYGQFGTTIAATYSANVKKDLFYTRVRKFPSSVEASLFQDEIPLQVYDNLVRAVHDGIPVLNKYLALRKKALKLPEIHMYDLYCSMVDDYQMDLPYPEAYKLVLEGLQPMGQDYVDVLKKAYTAGWIDVYPNKNKSSGAYSLGSLYDVHPYVLLNHNDNLDGAMTIAHELGHAMHSYLSNHNQPNTKADYSLFVAEVASTCNEIVVMNYLMNKFKDDDKAQAYLCNYLLEQFRTTVFRQTMFAEFEWIAHGMAQNGEALTREALSQKYMELNQKYYGDECVVDQLIADEWMRIPHFYRSFYVYKYATGFSAAVYLANRILTEGAPAVADFRKFLSAGSSVPPIEALKLAGVDMADPKPIQDGMKVFKETVDRLTALMA